MGAVMLGMRMRAVCAALAAGPAGGVAGAP